MPRRMRADAAALSRRRRRARCSSARSCGGPGGPFRSGCPRRQGLGETWHLQVAVRHWPPHHTGPRPTHRRPQAAKLVLLQVLPRVHVFILPFKRADAARLLLARPAAAAARGSVRRRRCRRQRRRRQQGGWRALLTTGAHIISSPSSSGKSTPAWRPVCALRSAIPPLAAPRLHRCGWMDSI